VAWFGAGSRERELLCGKAATGNVGVPTSCIGLSLFFILMYVMEGLNYKLNILVRFWDCASL